MPRGIRENSVEKRGYYYSIGRMGDPHTATRENMMEKPRKRASWKPRRNGEFYCSPGCGGGKYCKWADYQLAIRRANLLITRLGPGWKPVVWENLGWHFEVIDKSGYLKVHPSYHGGKDKPDAYHAYLGVGPGGKWVEYDNTPEKAIRKVLGVARAHMAELGMLIDAGAAATSPLRFRGEAPVRRRS